MSSKKEEKFNLIMAKLTNLLTISCVSTNTQESKKLKSLIFCNICIILL